MRNLILAILVVSLTIFSTSNKLYSAGGGRLLVVNQVDHTLTIVDPDSGKLLSTVTVGVNGHEVIASPDGALAYVPIYSNVGLGVAGTDGKSIDVVDIAAGKLAYSIDLGKPVRPHKPAFGQDGLLYVTAELENAIYVIDPSTKNVIASIPTGEPQSHMVALHGDRGYTANVSTGTVSILDLKQRKEIGEIHAADSIQRITLSPDGTLAFVHAKSGIIVVDTAKLQVKATIPTSAAPYSSAITNDGKFLIALMPTEPRLAVIDLAHQKVIREVSIPPASTEAIMDPRGGRAYISSYTGGQVTVLNVDTWAVDKTINLSKGVDGLAWANSR
jgi:YVTN family beta-propeller protein